MTMTFGGDESASPVDFIAEEAGKMCARSRPVLLNIQLKGFDDRSPSISGVPSKYMPPIEASAG